MTKKRGLSSTRGLDALIGNIKKEEALTKTAVAIGDERINTDERVSIDSDDGDVALIQIDVDKLQAGRYQPRKAIQEEALLELANSIAKHGVMQPIVIRPLLDSEKTDNGITHEIIAGERRWRAAKLAKLSTIPAIHRLLSDELAIALALIENIQREDLSVLEQAEALARFHSEFGMSHAMIADVVGKARTTVSNLLRLNQLHNTVKEHLQAGKIDMGHARALLGLSKEQQPIIAQKIVAGKLTVRQTEKLVKSIINPPPPPKKSPLHELEQLERQLADTLGLPVKVKQGKAGRGSIELFFHDNDQLATLLGNLTK